MHTDPRSRREIGSEFESRAVEYLERKGYQILDRNRVYPWGEIDIIAEETAPHPTSGQVRTLVFVEVRGTVDGSWLTPPETVSPRKVARLKRAIETYLLFYRGRAVQVRIDLIAVRGEEPVEHFPHFISI